MQLVKKLFWASRPVSWVNTAYPFAVAYGIVAGRVDALLVVGTLYFLVPYNLLMYGINDVFDYESDLHNARKGGIEGSLLERRQHKAVLWAAVLSNLPFVVVLCWLAGTPAAAAVFLAVLFLVVAYSAPRLRFKERPVLDSVTSSMHFVGPMAFALVAAHAAAHAWGLAAAFFLWGMASHAFGAVQDIKADRAGGIGSVATVIGARRTVRFAALLYLLSAIILGFYGWWAALVILADLAYIANIYPYWHVTDDTAERANRAWRRFLWLNLVTGFLVSVTLLLYFRVN